jgi:hypothetical protein
MATRRQVGDARADDCHGPIEKSLLTAQEILPSQSRALGGSSASLQQDSVELTLVTPCASSTLIHPMRIKGGTDLRKDNYGRSGQRHRGG